MVACVTAALRAASISSPEMRDCSCDSCGFFSISSLACLIKAVGLVAILRPAINEPTVTASLIFFLRPSR